MPPARPEPTEARGCPRRLNGKDMGEGSGEGAPRTRSAVRPRSCSALAKSQKPPRDARAVQRREGSRWEEAPTGPGRPPRSHPTGTGQGTTGRRRCARQSFAKRPPKRPWARDGFRRRHSRHLERHDLGGGIPAVVASPWWHPHGGTPGGGTQPSRALSGPRMVPGRVPRPPRAPAVTCDAGVPSRGRFASLLSSIRHQLRRWGAG